MYQYYLSQQATDIICWFTEKKLKIQFTFDYDRFCQNLRLHFPNVSLIFLYILKEESFTLIWRLVEIKSLAWIKFSER